MKLDEVKEWYQIAGEDFYTAQIMNNQVRKPIEIICYHCAQSIEKYLKGYLVYRETIPPKTHDLTLLLDLCVEFDNFFDAVRMECSVINRYSNEIRYPYRIEINQTDVDYSIKAVERVMKLEPIKKVLNKINDEGAV